MFALQPMAQKPQCEMDRRSGFPCERNNEDVGFGVLVGVRKRSSKTGKRTIAHETWRA